MNSQIRALRIASAIFALFALAHLWRFITKTEVVVSGRTLPMWPSVLFAIIALGLSLWMWRLTSRR
jgi:hypothetical protein